MWWRIELPDPLKRQDKGLNPKRYKMDQDDDMMIHHLEFDVELHLAGPNDKTVTQWTSAILRRLADQLDRDEFESGWHDVPDNTGKKVGQVYVDFSGEQ
jgi:hypothetical protein